MKIYIIGFRGTGFRHPDYKTAPLLIRAGHVGVTFEGANGVIYGFRPTDEAVATATSDRDLINRLKNGEVFEGALFDDTAIFEMAHALAPDYRNLEQLEGPRPLEVWQVSQDVDEAKFASIVAQLQKWYHERATFAYAFPVGNPAANNCATFPGKLDIELPEPEGQLSKYIDAMTRTGLRWP